MSGVYARLVNGWERMGKSRFKDRKTFRRRRMLVLCDLKSGSRMPSAWLRLSNSSVQREWWIFKMFIIFSKSRTVDMCNSHSYLCMRTLASTKHSLLTMYSSFWRRFTILPWKLQDLHWNQEYNLLIRSLFAVVLVTRIWIGGISRHDKRCCRRRYQPNRQRSSWWCSKCAAETKSDNL